jgi:hypothetical protein
MKKFRSHGQGSGTHTPARAKRRFGVLVFIVAVFLVTVGASLGVYRYVNNRPEKVLADALVTTVADLLAGAPSTTTGTVVFETKGDQAAKITVAFNAKAKNEDSQSSADIAIEYGGRTYSTRASAVFIGEDEYYFKIENLTKLLQEFEKSNSSFAHYSAYFNPIADKTNNKWVKVTSADLEDYGLGGKFNDACSVALGNLRLSSSDQVQIKKLFNQNQFLVTNETPSSSRISGESSFHYKLDFNDKAAEMFAAQVLEIPSLNSVKKDCRLGVVKADASTVSSAAKPVIELWVGKRSRRPTKIRVVTSKNNLTIDLDAQIKLNAKNVVVEKPAGAIPLSELKNELQKLMPTSTSN